MRSWEQVLKGCMQILKGLKQILRSVRMCCFRKFIEAPRRQLWGTLVHSIGKLKVNLGTNIISLCLSETVLGTSFWILSGLILAPLGDIFWVRKWVETLRRLPKEPWKAQRYPEEPSWVARGLSWGASEGSCHVFWAQRYPKRVAKWGQKGVQRSWKRGS